MKTKSVKVKIYRLLALFIWLIIWELGASRLKNPILLPYPWDVLQSLMKMLGNPATYRVAAHSLSHIALGFLLSVTLGILLGILCHRFALLDAFFALPMKLAKTVPVASVIILLLVWLSSSRLSIFVALLMCLPIVYENVRAGLAQKDPKLMEMGRIFHMSPLRRFRFLTIPTVMPYLMAAISMTISISFKAGIAAEVIGLARQSIGRNLYDAKLYLDMPALFSWTILIVILSILFERVVLFVVRLLELVLCRPTVLKNCKATVRYLLFGGEPQEAAIVTDEMVTEIATATDFAATEQDAATKQNDTTTDVSHNREVLALQNVSFSYGPKPILHDLTLSLRENQVLVVSGESGIGKTTLLRILSGELAPTSGEVKGREGVELCVHFQENRLLDGFSPLLNVTLGEKKMEASARQMLTDLGITDLENKAAGDFSGGEKRRIAFARAIVRKPGILLLDEPFTGIDSERKKEIMDMMSICCKNTAIVVVTHNTSETLDFCEKFKGVEKLQFELL